MMPVEVSDGSMIAMRSLTNYDPSILTAVIPTLAPTVDACRISHAIATRIVVFCCTHAMQHDGFSCKTAVSTDAFKHLDDKIELTLHNFTVLPPQPHGVSSDALPAVASASHESALAASESLAEIVAAAPAAVVYELAPIDDDAVAVGRVAGGEGGVAPAAVPDASAAGGQEVNEAEEVRGRDPKQDASDAESWGSKSPDGGGLGGSQTLAQTVQARDRKADEEMVMNRTR